MTEQDEALKEAELEALKEKATSLGLEYHPNIGAEKLSQRIKEHLETEGVNEDDDEDDETETEPTETTETAIPNVTNASGTSVAPQVAAPPAPKLTKAQKRLKRKKDQLKLVRVRVACMNPNKSAYEGELFTVSNKLIGTYKKMVPFDVPWHVPQIMLNMIKERQCQIFKSVRDPQTGRDRQEAKNIREFAVEILDPLTDEERHSLAQRQAMANGTAEAA